MTTYQSAAFTADINTDAAWRAWGSAVSAGMAAVGLVQGSDTGQINWSTSTHPTAGSQLVGYEIWKFNDTLQSTAPIVIRLEYRSSGSGAGFPILNAYVGGTTDGSGNIVNPQYLATSPYTFNYSNQSIVGLTTNICYTNGYLMIMGLCGPGIPGNYAGNLVIERLRDTSGNPTGRGVVSLLQASSFVVYSFSRSAISPTYGINAVAYWPLYSQSGVIGNQRFVCPPTIASGDNVHGTFEKTLGSLSVGMSDYSFGTTFQVTRWDGVAHTYRVFIQGNVIISGTAYASSAFLWE